MPFIIKQHESTHVLLVGAGHLRPKLEKLARELGVEKYITFLGFVSEEDKILAYCACDFFVLPSLAELEGMVVLEAMACGEPILISDAKMSASRFFVDGNGFLFKTLDAEDLAEQALKLILNPGLRKEMGKVSLEKVKQYDIHKSVLKLEGVYYQVLQK
jgi:glycosyltransferase involved in cell wall biosynthesis